MFKKLFCEHYYEHYHTDEYLGLLTGYWFTQWHYVCKKCGKTNVIQEEALRDFLSDVAIKVKKEEVFGTDNLQYRDLKFYIGSYELTGKNAYYAQKRLSKFHQDKTISKYHW